MSWVIGSIILTTGLGTAAAVGLNIFICYNITNISILFPLLMKIYNSGFYFGMFIDLFTMLDVFNFMEKMHLKTLFNNLQKQINFFKNLKPNNRGQIVINNEVLDPSKIIPYQDPEFIQLFIALKLLGGNIENIGTNKLEFGNNIF
jgi:hypothetical protein